MYVHRGRVVHRALRDAGGTRPEVGAAVRGRCSRTMRLAEGSLRAVVADRPRRLAHDAERSQCRAGGESPPGGHADAAARYQRTGGGIRASLMNSTSADAWGRRLTV